MAFLDIHIIQSVPYANLNRDDLGTPKTVLYGGVTRARVSSQSWKRAARTRIEELLTSAKTYRTRNHHARLGELMVEIDPTLTEADIEQIAANVFTALGTDKKEKNGSVILFVGEVELRELAAAAVEHATKLSVKLKAKQKVDADVTKALKGCLMIPRPTSVALFGRMLADAPEINVDAAMQVAHAMSTHPIDIEVDYFTAAEDLPTEEDLTGAAHVGTAEFVSSTLYRYATVNLGELTENCGGDHEVAAELARLAIASLCLSLPTGKNNVTAPHTLPTLVNIVVRDDRPVSYAAAFEAPAKRSRDGGYLPDTLAKLTGHTAQIGKMLSGTPLLDGYVLAAETDTLFTGDEYEGLDTLIADAVEAAQGTVGEEG